VSCFFIAQITVTDREEYQKYLDGYDEIFARYEGLVEVVDENPTLLEGEWPCTRTVVIRFPDETEARRWYDSPEYEKLAAHRPRASECNVVLVTRQSRREPAG
jgi:uncharacterized protein (DUF1330 family)